MNSRTKLLIAQPDGAKLVSLLLWFEQYTDLDVVGTTSSGEKLVGNSSYHQPDVVLADFSLLADEKQSIAKIKATSTSPSILVMHESDIAPLESALGKDFDGYINPKLSLNELTEAIRRAAQKHAVASASTFIPTTMAG